MEGDVAHTRGPATAVQFLKYCAVGAINTVVDLAVYYLLTRHAGLGGDLAYAAKTVSFVIATFNSYVLNRVWTFEAAHPFSFRQLGRFYLAIGSGVVINVGVFAIGASLFGVHDLVSAAVAAVATAAWGFTLSRRFVFT